MIIVFFHVLYLLGKFIYRNYREDDFGENDEEKNSGEVVVVMDSACGVEANQLNKQGDQLDLYDNFYGEDEFEHIRFTPPAYIQRYHAVASLLGGKEFEGQFRKVVDFGCSEFGFFQHLKNTRGIEEILCVDVDKNTLEKYKGRIEPLTSDYLACKNAPLNVHVLEGSVTDNDQCLENTDAVICIELIEHLYPETCINLPFNIFGFIQPKIAVFTTPNADFNVLFKGMNGFRHWDHKFEWSREQFQDWANNIITRYPNYRVHLTGICNGPPGSEDLGHCSQMATFIRKLERIFSPGTLGLFKLITTVQYPYRVDNRSVEEKTLQEAVYYLRHYSLNNEDEVMPLQLLAKWIDTVSVNTLKNILEKEGWQIVNDKEKGLSAVCPPLSEYSEFDDNDDNDDYDNNTYLNQWNDQPTEPPYQHQDWPEIHDKDEEMWDNDESNDSSVSSGCDLESMLFSNNSTPSTSKNYDGCGSIASTGHLFSMNSQSCMKKNCNNSGQVSINSGEENLSLKNKMDEMDKDLCHLTAVSSSTAEQLSTDDMIYNNDSMTLGSIYSMYLESSTCKNDEICPENITNDPDFQWSNDTSIGDIGSCNEMILQSFLPSSTNDSPNLTSTPMKLKKISQQDDDFSQQTRVFVKCNDFKENNVEENGIFMSEISSEKYPVLSSDSCSSCEKEKFEVMRKLKESALMENMKNDDRTCSNKKQFSLNEDDTPQLSSIYHGPDSTFHTNRCKNTYSTTMMTKRPLSLSTCDQLYQQQVVDRHVVVKEIKNFELEEVDDKASLSEAKCSTPNSWSPEFCLDSGYPNTSSVHDITPEYDLSSIGQDTISESQSPSFAEPPRQLEALVGVENGDLVNNNRDGEGNNVIPVEENQLDEEREQVDENENIDA
ncbi:uncharacterized protein LOC107038909 isoform X2 [Diachasma alloeum]|uniref:uncharacterized protein LOC107038909 isoform X2 n=1 Tax=Diachasma alloeum TaxID=454923 RepID=UPI0007382A2D|nr:uncharacterized protein LOC107038909 isoform X2 [Diachasma alloeum]